MVPRGRGEAVGAKSVSAPSLRFRFFHDTPEKLWVRWTLLALAFRLIEAATRFRWNHPDEWYQTIELSNALVRGEGIFTQEVAFHMRNLSWPTLLAIPASLEAPLGLRIFLILATVAVLGLGVSWGLRALAERDGLSRTRAWPWALATFAFAWFIQGDLMRPSQETAATIAVWTALGMLATGQPLLAGIAALACAAFKTPAALFTAGLGAVMLARAVRSGEWRSFAKFAAGLALGGALFGLQDWRVYGHPWEGFWTHFLYNGRTGLSASLFGTQPVSTYLELFTGHWGNFLAPLGLALTTGFLYAFPKACWRLEPWAWALAAYAIGHLFSPHREPRFMAPIELLWAYGGALGMQRLWERVPSDARTFRRLSLALTALLFAVNLPFFVKQLWGNLWVPDGTYFEIERHLAEHPQACAVITVRKPLAVTLPRGWQTRAFGYFPQKRGEEFLAEAALKPLTWLERAPRCAPEQAVLLHARKPSPALRAAGCEVLRSGLLNILPRASWETVLARGWVSGAWLRCPSTMLDRFAQTRTLRALFHEWKPLERFPSAHVTGPEILEMIARERERLNVDEGSFSDFES